MQYHRPRLPSQLTYNDLNGAEAIEILTDWFRQLLQSQPQLQPHLTLPMAKITLNVGVYIEMHVGGTVPVASPPELLGINGNVTLDNRSSDESVGPIVTVERDLSAVVNAAPISGGSPPDKIREQHNLPIPRPSYGPRETGSHLFLADVIEYTPDITRVWGTPSGGPDTRSDTRSGGPPTTEPGAAHEVRRETGGREGAVAEGYVFSSEVVNAGPQEQRIPIDRGAIEIDLTGEGKMRQGSMIVTAGTHVASAKVLGDQGGAEYGSVGTTYDPGPAGLARPGHGGGLYRDGRSRISFGNNNRG